MVSERRQFARALRRQATKAEDILWAQLRASRLHGAKFRRQVPFDRFCDDLEAVLARIRSELDLPFG
jgi:very-short-patch-repair endonuclease